MKYIGVLIVLCYFKLPKRHQAVEYKPVDSENWKRCRILSKCKSTGQSRNYVNIRDVDDNTEDCIDWEEDVQEWNVLNNNVFLATGKDAGYEVAKETELENWKKMGVYEVVEDEGTFDKSETSSCPDLFGSSGGFGSGGPNKEWDKQFIPHNKNTFIFI